MKTECPADNLLFRWLDQKQVQRENGLTEHIYTCTTCSHAVLAEARIRRDRKRLGGLSGIAAVALLSLGLWHTGYVFSSGPAATEVAEIAGPLYPTDLPQPIQPDGTLWRADHRSSREDPTPYPPEEEVMGQRSPRVLAWLRVHNEWGDEPVFIEEGVTEFPLTLGKGMAAPETMTEAEFRHFAATWGGFYYPLTVRALRRAVQDHADYMIPLALLWYTSDITDHATTGWKMIDYHSLARDFIHSFTQEEILNALNAYPNPHFSQKVRDTYQAYFLQ